MAFPLRVTSFLKYKGSYTNIQKFEVSKKLILLFSKGVLNLSKVTVKALHFLNNISKRYQINGVVLNILFIL